MTISVHDNGFPAYWGEERDWLVEVAMLPKDDPEGNLDELEWIGKVFAFAMATNTRMLAQVGDPVMPAYELWFSFSNEEDKRRFLDLVREEGYANPDEEGEFDPPASLEDLPNLRPIAPVFPKEDVDHIMALPW